MKRAPRIGRRVSPLRWTAGMAAGALAFAAAAAVLGWVVGVPPAITLGLAAVTVVGAAALMLHRRRAGRSAGFAAGAVQYVVVGAVVLAAAQLVPYGRSHANPAGAGEPLWANDRTRALAVDACYGCHSNDVRWPWYSNVAPISWAITNHVEEGREALNFSNVAADPGEADDAVETILEASMPPAYYTRFGLHGEAKLSEAEKADLVAGLRATPGFADEHSDQDSGQDGDQD
ncbi:MAG: heme-binding domain-containing protein [Acidimicrobiales bacterium]